MEGDYEGGFRFVKWASDPEKPPERIYWPKGLPMPFDDCTVFNLDDYVATDGYRVDTLREDPFNPGQCVWMNWNEDFNNKHRFPHLHEPTTLEKHLSGLMGPSDRELEALRNDIEYGYNPTIDDLDYLDDRLDDLHRRAA